jgi:Uma2 family endonuclease
VPIEYNSGHGEQAFKQTFFGTLPMTPTAPSSTMPPPPVSRRGDPTWEIAYLYPTQGNWAESEYLAIGTNHLIEFSDGCLEVLPMPTPFHQFIVDYLLTLLKAFVGAHASGSVLFAPMPIRLWPGKLREPDIVYFRPGRIRDPRMPPEGADLAMEVVSEGEENRKRDLETKREEYARAGIAEYWIVDSQEQRITVLALEGSSYRVHGVFGRGATATSVLLPGLGVSVDATLAAGEGK